MKKAIMIGTFAMLLLSACSREARNDADELGKDMGRDMEKATQSVERQVKDAAD